MFHRKAACNCKRLFRLLDRKDIINQSVTGTPVASYRKEINIMAKVKIGIIGVGNISESHIAGYKKDPNA
jgi:hypothetical protein